MISFKYRFYDRSSDGLLKNPSPAGPYYNEDRSLQRVFESEQEALDKLTDFSKKHDGYSYYIRDLILVKEVCIS